MLHRDAIRPWFYRSSISARDPNLVAERAVALDVYVGLFEGQPLDEGEFLVCADEKTIVQARCRCQPTLPPGLARLMRVDETSTTVVVLNVTTSCTTSTVPGLTVPPLTGTGRGVAGISRQGEGLGAPPSSR